MGKIDNGYSKRGNFIREMETMKSSMACPTPKCLFSCCRTEQCNRRKRLGSEGYESMVAANKGACHCGVEKTGLNPWSLGALWIQLTGSCLPGQYLCSGHRSSPQHEAIALLSVPQPPLLFHTHAAQSHDHPD